MTFTEFDNVLSRFSRPPHSRAVLALVHAVSDSRTRENVVPFGSSNGVATTLDSDPPYFQKLLKDPEVSKAWNDYTDVTDNEKFPQKLAKGTAALHGFRHYTLQDAIYLEYYLRVKLEAIAAPGSKVSADDLREFAHHIISGLDFSASTRASCETQLGVPKPAIDDEWNSHRSNQLQASIKFYEDVISGKADEKYTKAVNPWLDIHFALLPCIKGYYTIATNVKDPLPNTLYYPMWIEANQYVKYVKDYDVFINNNIKGADENDWNHWRRLFQQACKNEKAFFDLVLSDHGAYDIVREGKNIPILPHGSITAYLAPGSGDGVILQSQEVKWELTNAIDGYTIKIKGDDAKYKFLKAVPGTKQVSTTEVESQATKWDINFTTKDQTYQLFVGGNVNLALNVENVSNTVNLAENNLVKTKDATVVTAQTNWVFKKA